MLFTAAFSLTQISSGVRAGARMPIQPLIPRPSMPSSSSVGTIGKAAARARLRGSGQSNGAWRLVAEGFDLSIQRTAVLGQVSVTTVKTMRNQLRRITEAGENPLHMDWERARQWPKSRYDHEEPESWCELKVQELAERIIK